MYILGMKNKNREPNQTYKVSRGIALAGLAAAAATLGIKYGYADPHVEATKAHAQTISNQIETSNYLITVRDQEVKDKHTTKAMRADDISQITALQAGVKSAQAELPAAQAAVAHAEGVQHTVDPLPLDEAGLALGAALVAGAAARRGPDHQ
jgi:hypothetical protein